MKRMLAAGTAIAMLAACGCNESREAKALKEQVAQISTKNAMLEARVKAVEEACLELNTRISTAAAAAQQYQARAHEAAAAPGESQPAAPSSPAAAAAAPADAPAPPPQQDGGLMNLVSSSPDLHARPTRQNFSRKLTGKTLTEVLAMIDKPDKTEEKDGAKHWTYNALILDVEKGGVEECPALIVLENDTVTRAQLMTKP